MACATNCSFLFHVRYVQASIEDEAVPQTEIGQKVTTFKRKKLPLTEDITMSSTFKNYQPALRVRDDIYLKRLIEEQVSSSLVFSCSPLIFFDKKNIQ